MPTALIPDSERLVYDYLSAHGSVSALGTRFVGRTPRATGAPWVRITLLDARQAARPTDHLTDFLLQFDIYAGSQAQVVTHANTIRAALLDMQGGIHSGSVVTDVRFAGMFRTPDTDFEPARERVILTASVFAHPA